MDDADDPAEEDDDFEVELEAVDVVSFALAVGSLGVNALVSGSILAATAPVTRNGVGFGTFFVSSSFRGGICRVHICFEQQHPMPMHVLIRNKKSDILY